jgi:hypothetical protein
MLAASVAGLLVDMLPVPSALTEIIFLIISFTIIFAVMTVIFYLSGNAIVGRKRVSLKDSFTISVLGTLVLIVCLSVFSLELALLLSLFAWLLLVKYYYETGFAGSIAVAVTSAFVSLVVLEVLSALLDMPLIFNWLPASIIG